MQIHRAVLAFATASAIAISLYTVPAAAQDVGPGIAAGGLVNPRGFTWNAEGQLVIAEAGSGGATEASGEVEVPAPTGPYTGGTTAAVVKFDNGCAVPLASGLPSAQSATGEIVGAADVAYLGDTLYALIAGGGAAHGNSDQPSGLYTIGDDGTTPLVVDLGQWLRDNPVANPPELDFDPEGSFFNMVAAPDGSALWIVESNSEQVLAVTPDGTVTRLADLSDGNQVPTAIAAAPDGGIYVGFLTSVPYPDGGASVIEIAPDGTITTVWTGLTTITGLAVGPDGALYASQLATTRKRPPFLEPATGSIVRQTGESTSAKVVTGLNFPVAIRFGPDGALYVALPAIGASDGTGVIVRYLPSDQPVSIDVASLPVPPCGDGTAGSGSGGGESGGVPSEVVVRIYDNGFDNQELTVPIGTTVIWANTGETQHTTVAIVNGEIYWDSGIIKPGGTFNFTFTEPGTWTYTCSLHPEMTGTITVE